MLLSAEVKTLEVASVDVFEYGLRKVLDLFGVIARDGILKEQELQGAVVFQYLVYVQSTDFASKEHQLLDLADRGLTFFGGKCFHKLLIVALDPVVLHGQRFESNLQFLGRTQIHFFDGFVLGLHTIEELFKVVDPTVEEDDSSDVNIVSNKHAKLTQWLIEDRKPLEQVSIRLISFRCMAVVLEIYLKHVYT